MIHIDSYSGVITHINVSDGGVPKQTIPRALVRDSGLEGDRQKNLKYHGGPDRAICLWSTDIINQLQAEGHPIRPGSTGENVTIAGLSWNELVPGKVLTLGTQVRLEVTDYAQPCRTIAKSFHGGRYGRISQKKHPGLSRIYTRILQTGTIQVGDRVKIEATRD